MRRKKGFFVLACFLLLLLVSPGRVRGDVLTLDGKKYLFQDSEAFPFLSQNKYVPTNTVGEAIGSLSLSGSFQEEGPRGTIPSFVADGETITLTYDYRIPDGCEMAQIKDHRIGDYPIGGEGEKGVILMQTSLDHENWFTHKALTNVFTDAQGSIQVHKPKILELANGSFYRIIVAYRQKIEGEGWGPFERSTYRKCAEVYELYVEDTGRNAVEPSQENRYYFEAYRHILNCGDDEGYNGGKPLSGEDIHNDWSMGDFFISGFSGITKDEKGNPVFLKNVGDRVTLWYHLDQNITSIGGNENLQVVEDRGVYDQALNRTRMDFGKGALVLSHLDYQNKTKQSQTYVDFLVANTSPGANTQVVFYEEGDYEIALDYKIKRSGFRKVENRYRTAFSFSVHNSNCMVYLFSLDTGSLMNNGGMAKQGFYVDMAGSHSLDVKVHRYVLQEARIDGLLENLERSWTAKEGDTYTDPGKYVLTVTNIYTGDTTTLNAYVGEDKYFLACEVNEITLEELKRRISLGAKVLADGSIVMPRGGM